MFLVFPSNFYDYSLSSLTETLSNSLCHSRRTSIFTSFQPHSLRKCKGFLIILLHFMYVACAFLISVLLFELCDICYSCMEWVYTIGLAKGIFLILVIWCLLHLYSWLLLYAYHFHGRMSQWQTFVTLWLTIVYSELNCVCLFIIAEHLLHVLVYIGSVLLLLAYCWLGSCTVFKWYLGLNFHGSPIFDYRESN